MGWGSFDHFCYRRRVGNHLPAVVTLKSISPTEPGFFDTFLRTASVISLRTASVISLDSVPVMAQPENNRDTNAKRSVFQSGGSPCRRLKNAIRKIRNRRRTKTSLRPMCRPTRRRKARASRPAARSRKRPDARFGLKHISYNNPKALICR
jgi:hypothetical protein